MTNIRSSVSSRARLRTQLVRVCHLLAEKDYVSAMDGNVSVRLENGSFLSTPTMVHKAFVTEEDLVIVDGEGRLLEGPPGRGPTSEIHMHLAAYRQRPEIQAVVHAHPPTAIAFTVAGESLDRCVLPEVVLTLGSIPTAQYHTTGSRELAEEVGIWIRRYDAVLLAQHGAVAVGTDLIDAYGKLEKIEHTAMILLRARLLGRIQELPGGEVEQLRLMGRRYSANGMAPPACGAGATEILEPENERKFQPSRAVSSAVEATSLKNDPSHPMFESERERLEQLVIQEVLRALGRS